MMEHPIKYFSTHQRSVSPSSTQVFLPSICSYLFTNPEREKFMATASQRVTQSRCTFISCAPLPPVFSRHRAGDSLFWEPAKQKRSQW